MAPFAARRHALAATIQASGGGVAIVPTAPERMRNRDTDYAYRHDSYFYYLSAFTEPEAVVVMTVPREGAARTVLFCRPKHEEREIWDGFRYGPAAAQNTFGFDEAFNIEEIADKLPELIGNQPALWYALGQDSHWDGVIMNALNSVRANARSGVHAPRAIHDVRALLDEQRLRKDTAEIEAMRCAAQISRRAHTRAMRVTRPGRFEYEIEAELLHEFRRSGAAAPAYTSIVAGGANACVLHYVSNDCRLRDGDLVLIDAGCEYDGYAADITRTYPVNGRFSGPQRDVYELVLASQYAALAEARPWHSYDATHDAAVNVLAQGMLDLGLLKGSLEEVIETASYRRFYMHRTGHWLGMDVHDAGEYKTTEGTWRQLEPGMVITIEPGCYIRPGDDVPEAFWNIGVRIEDDVLITDAGHEILTEGTPKTVAEIESIMHDEHA
jgi:Xaa-Pro aminopeptidase